MYSKEIYLNAKSWTFLIKPILLNSYIWMLLNLIVFSVNIQIGDLFKITDIWVKLIKIGEISIKSKNYF